MKKANCALLLILCFILCLSSCSGTTGISIESFTGTDSVISDTVPGTEATTETETVFSETTGPDDITDTPESSGTEESATTVKDSDTVAPVVSSEEITTQTEPECSFPLGIYVFTAGQKYFTRVSDWKSRWPVDDSDTGKDSSGNYKAWVSGYWTRDTWNFKPEVHLICDTKYFFLIPSDAERIDFKNKYWTSGWAEEWMELWKAAGLEGYSIGYTLETVLKNGETRKMTVLDPSKTFENVPYCEVWLYDEIARPNEDHITLDLMNSGTLLTDIKITLRNGCYDVDRFVLTAFVYSSGSDFDSEGNYAGRNCVSCSVSASNR